MIQPRLRDELDRAASRLRRLRVWQLLSVAWLLLTAAGLGLLAWEYATRHNVDRAILLFAALGVLTTALAIGVAIRSVGDRLALARRIEERYPELSACLLAAVEQRPDPETGAFGFLQSSVIRQALDHARRHPWSLIVPAGRMRWAVVRAVSAFGLLIAVMVALATTDFPAIASTEGDSPEANAGHAAFAFSVEPGHTEVEKGTSLLVLARITGEIPPDASLLWKSTGEESQLAMSRSLNDPVFGGRVPSVVEPLDYRVEMNGQRSEDFHVTVFEYPRLDRADARLVYPKYAGLAERTIEDVRVLSVPEGTELTLICRLNKPVASATLHEDQAEPIALVAVPGDAPVWEAKILCDRTRQLKLELVDEAGRRNQKPASFKINVLPNQPVALKPVFPARDLEASPLEEIDVKATAWDDYGVKRYGVSYALAGETAVDVVLGEDAAAKQKHELSRQIRLEELNAEPDELLSYHWWAEDLGNDGQPRRVESDMYFAEVRRFEEIFREGEQPAGGEQQRQQQQGQGQNAQDAQELAKLQKDIINATWKVIRREIGSSLTDKFNGDVEELALSQQQALEQAEGLSERIEDPESLIHVEDVLSAMKGAIVQLETARKDSSTHPLQKALKEEQKAYQALLKLRAREHRVVRQQRQQGGAASARSQQQQRQMEELDLKDEKNPYEAQRLAQSEQQDTPENRENRQVLNRLRELARRQNDLNERLKELQASLEEAPTEEQKEEIRRQLKRLQEEQQQILQDTDELQARMDQPENQERMAQERQQLEEAREQARRSSEALEQEQVTQAAATGTRAQKEFEELRNEFRRRTSGQFTEEMREMRDTAREMDTRQQELSKELKGESQPEDPSQPKSLADDTQGRERTAQELAGQRQRLADLQEQMRRTIEESETTEPLLAERLYEAARGAQEQNLDRTLQAAESSLRRGLLGDATQQEEAAGRGVTQLREGIERAAEAVLGDEAEALRRAREEVERLNRELNQEIARNQPRRPGDQQAANERQGDDVNQRGEGRQQSPATPPTTESPSPDAQRGQRSGDQQGGRQQQAGPQPEGESGREPRPGEQPQGQGQSGRAQEGRQQQEPGSQGGQPRQPGERSPMGQGQSGEQPGDQQGQTPQGQSQQQDGQPQSGHQQPGGQQQGGQQQAGQQPGQRGGQPQQRGGPQSLGDPSGPGGAGPWSADDSQREYAPLTGGDFLRWSDRLRDVEEMVEDPELRSEAARIRERARAIRGEFKRHSKMPEWDVVEGELAVPLMRLRDRISEELLRRTSREAIVPLDRDPVPPEYTEKTRRYYERLGTGR